MNFKLKYYREYFDPEDIRKLGLSGKEASSKIDANWIKDFKKGKINKEQIFVLSEAMKLLPEGIAYAFELETIYPGLLVGSGYLHEAQIYEGEHKLGFFFDHSSGIPVIPGSSVKGTLRSYFPGVGINRESGSLKGWEDENRDRAELLRVISGRIDEPFPELSDEQLALLEYQLFEGRVVSGDGENLEPNKFESYGNRDIFFDAFPISGIEVFEEDTITPHSDWKKDPVPIQFIKIKPGIKFRFCFKLTDSDLNGPIISGKQKMALFQELLVFGGIGAKTNVGYGQFKVLPIAKKYDKGDKLTGIVKEFKEEPNGMNAYVEISELGDILKVLLSKKQYDSIRIESHITIEVTRVSEKGRPITGKII